MNTLRRFLAAIVLTAVASGSAIAAAPPALAQADSAVAVNTHDGLYLFKLSFHIRKVVTDTVAVQNAAVAVSSCEECTTIAIAIQVVLASNDPDAVSAENVAIAMNIECSACETLAAAYQWIFVGNAKLRFTEEGKEELKRIRKALKELGKQQLSVEEVNARVAELMEQLSVVLTTQLVAIEKDDDDEAEEPDDDQEASPSPSPSATPESPTASPSPSESATATPTPTESAA